MDAAPLTNSNSNEVNPGNVIETKELPENVQEVFDLIKTSMLDSYLNNEKMTEADSILLKGSAVYNETGMQGGKVSLKFDIVALKNEIESRLKDVLAEAYAANKDALDRKTLSEINFNCDPVTIPAGYSGDLQTLPTKFGGGYREIRF